MAFKLPRIRRAPPRVKHVSLPGVHATLARTAAEAGSIAGRQPHAPGRRAPQDVQLRLY